ncbi:MAG TPA: MoaD/ThiS family protein [Gemmatimonadaceae bacterium]|nr:MoaD/ThiS family protein [Gemmatimonadaceae bacterium]
MPRIRVLLFASYAEALGASAIDVDVAPVARVRDVLDSVRTRAGAWKLPPHPLVAVNESYASLDDPVGERDEVAIIPPVAGG